MSKFSFVAVSALAFFAIAGCGASTEEMTPATETPPGPSPEEMQKLMQESMEKSGMQGQQIPQQGQ